MYFPKQVEDIVNLSVVWKALEEKGELSLCNIIETVLIRPDSDTDHLFVFLEGFRGVTNLYSSELIQSLLMVLV